MQEEIGLEELETITESLAITRALLDRLQDELTETCAPYERKIQRLTEMIQRVEGQENDDPAVQRIDELIAQAEEQHAGLATQAAEYALAAWEAGALGEKKRHKLDSGATIEIRETVKREITDPIALLDQVRGEGLNDKLITGVKVSVSAADFNKWVDLKEPKCVAVSKEVRAYVRF